ncbi:MAG: rhomboid family intramembrane serine protease [Candidatus Helarchaeota archaeon]|nr:rhomboid family intramembrane serine protease [Candidatus Helarchaeota archaeon]
MAIVFPRYFKKPIITISIVIINIIVFIRVNVMANWILGEPDIHFINLGFTASEFFNGRKLHTIITSMFLHGDIFHIGFNMFYFFLFSLDIEGGLGRDSFVLGRISFLIMYFFSGIVANLIYGLIASVFMNPGIPAIGASGAIFGVMGAYALLFPENQALVYVGRFFWRTRAWVAIIFYFVLQVIYGIIAAGSGVAYWAHVGGFLGGIGYILLVYKSRGIEFD